MLRYLRSIDFSESITGLEDGQYDVYYYSYSACSGMTAHGVAMGDLSGSGDPETLGVQGSNWDVVTVTISGGTLTILDSSPSSDGISGIQIVPR
jgi:hypothetical protein